MYDDGADEINNLMDLIGSDQAQADPEAIQRKIEEIEKANKAKQKDRESMRKR